ncbi:MAG: hemerythrin domain-containing protein [Actinomycetota bacterium]
MATGSGARSIQEEHAGFRVRLEAIERLADSIGDLPVAELRTEIASVHEFMAHSLMPHAVAEGRVLFPLVRKETGEPTIGVRMTQCHVQLGRLLDELEGLLPALSGQHGSPPPERDLRRVLYSVHAILGSHLEEADQDVQPLLEASLPPEQRAELFEAIERCAREVESLYE